MVTPLLPCASSKAKEVDACDGTRDRCKAQKFLKMLKDGTLPEWVKSEHVP